MHTKTPVTFRLYVPGVEDDNEQFTIVLLPDVRVTLEGHDAVRADGVVAEMLIVPANPDRLWKATASTAEASVAKEIVEGAAML